MVPRPLPWPLGCCFPNRLATGPWLALLAASLLASGAARAAETAVVQEILDGKELFIDQNPAQVSQTARAPQQLSTRNSRGQIRFDGGAVGRLNRFSQLRLGRDCFLVDRGQVLVSGRQSGCTRSARLSVRGTNDLLEVNDAGESNLSVLEGSVQVEPLRDGQPTGQAPSTVGAGQRLRLSPEGVVLSLLALSSGDYRQILAGPLFEGFRLPLPAIDALEGYLRSNVPGVSLPGVPALPAVPPPSLPLALLAVAGLSSRQADAHAELAAYGPEGSFRRLPAWEVLDPARWRSHPQRQSLKGALALVGPVVAQGDDGYPTPFGPLSGLELLATAAANSLQGDGLQPWPAAPVWRALVAGLPVLFSDLQGFTALTRERSAAGRSEDHVQQLNTYLGAMVEVITAHGGTVDKFIGDAVMAVFGSPVGRGIEVEARSALACALAMGQALEALNDTWRQEGETLLASGIGLASGAAVVGQIGSPRRMEFTVIGDPVNRAARLESLTRNLGVSLLFDRATADRIGGAVAWAPLNRGQHPIKGLGDVEVFSPPPELLAPGGGGEPLQG